jgi:DNA repair protein RecN (Recombination protein N)
MLVELDIRDLAVVDQARVSFAPGLTAITGETGAGKSLIIDALQLLLGGRADSTLIRAGAEAASVEGTFDFGDRGLPERLRELLAEAGIDAEDGMLILSRELTAGPRPRSAARINGRAVVQSTLAAVGDLLVDVHGQGEHVALLAPARHAEFLDRFAGTLDQQRALAEAVTRLRAVRAELERLNADERERIRREDRLRFERDEIAAARLRPDEEEALKSERALLANAERLAELAEAAIAALQGGGRGGAAVDALGHAADALAELANLDPRQRETAAAISALQEQAADLARDLRAYRDAIEHDPRRLGQIEERLALIAMLKRKYGSTIAEVIAYGERAERELEALANAESERERLGEEEAALAAAIRERARALSAAREAGAIRLVAAVRAELAELGLRQARFAVQFTRRPAANGLDLGLPAATIVEDEPRVVAEAPAGPLAVEGGGAERVEFLVTLNPGEPLRPLARVASGGETSRLMLALETVLGDAAGIPTMVFDEIEQGLGGRSGGIVGAKLAALARSRQVICITHLPQVAACAERHLVVSKEVLEGRTRTAVRLVRGEERQRELAAMFGAVTEATLHSAAELLAAAGSVG